MSSSNDSDLSELPDIESFETKKWTSTPIQQYFSCFSPSVSTIFTTDEIGMGDDSGDTFVIQRSWIKIKSIPKWLYPIRDRSIYHCILINPELMDSLIENLMDMYKKHPKSAICHVLQFFVDITGTQEVEIHKIYKCRELNVDNILTKIANTNKDLSKHPIFDYKLKSMVPIVASIERFLNKLIQKAYDEHLLYEDIFSVHILHMLQNMSFYQMYSLKVTGVISSMKLLTQYARIYYNEKEPGRRKKIIRFIHYLCIIIHKMCFIKLRNWDCVRMECAIQFRYWFKYIPSELFNITPKYISLFTCGNVEVRKAVLKTCKYILQRKVNEYTVLFFKEITESVCDRFNDINMDVSVEAVNLIDYAYEHNFPLEDMKCIEAIKFMTTFVCYDYFPLAEAAGKFLIRVLQSEGGELLPKLAQLGNYLKLYVPLIVEATYDATDTLQDWGLYVKLIMNNNISINTRRTLIKMAHCSIYQTLEGKTICPRLYSKSGNKADLTIKSAIAIVFIPKMVQFITIFEEYPLILIDLLDMVMLLYTSDISSNTYMDILEKLIKLYLIYDTEDMLYKLIECFYFFTQNNALNNRAKRSIDNLSMLYINKYVKENNSQHILSEVTLKLGVILSKYDLTEHLPWEIISSPRAMQVPQQTLMTCKWHLIWQLNNLKTNIEDGTQKQLIKIQNLSTMCGKFIKTCFKVLLNADYDSITTEVFMHLSELVKKFNIEWFDFYKKHKLTDILCLRIQREDEYLRLFNKIVENTNLPLTERQNVFKLVCEVIILESVNIKNIINVYQYYDKYFLEFGTTIEDCIVKMKKMDPHSLLILDTLTRVYENILSKEGYFDKKNKQYEFLQSLEQRFVNSKLVNFGQMYIIHGVQWSIKEKKNVSFLHVLIHFVKSLKADDKVVLLNKIKKSLENEDLPKYDCVMHFLEALKIKTIDKTKSTKMSSPSISEANISAPQGSHWRIIVHTPRREPISKKLRYSY